MDEQSDCTWTQEWHHDGVTVVNCSSCGYKHQYPYPTEEEVAALYRDEYYEEVKPEYQTIVEEDAAHFRMWARHKKSILERLLDTAPEPAPAILDVGCSFGQTLTTFAEAGWRAVGVEPSHSAASVAREQEDLEIFEDLIENIPLKRLGAPFDVVHMAEVINHLRDPRPVLRRIHDELLISGGIVVVETSNDFNPLQAAIVECYDDVPWWIVPDHVTYFNKASLSALLERIGYQVRHVEATFPMELFPLMGDNYRADPAIGKTCHRKRVRFEMNLEKTGRVFVRQDLYSALGSAGFGRSIIVYAQKV